MLNVKLLQNKALQNERIAEKRFKKMGYRVERLDRQGPRKRPDLLVVDGRGPLLVCEVRSIFSGRFLGDRNVHISTEDPRLLDSGVFQREITFEKIEEDLAESIEKYRTLSVDRPECKELPLVVAFFSDFFADEFDYYPSDMPAFPEISGILRIETDYEFQQVASKLSADQILQRILDRAMPPRSKAFRLTVNVNAAHPLPQHFIESCVT